MVSDAVAWYERHCREVVPHYEGLRFEDVHGWLLPLLPNPPGLVLDVGAGSGRDAAWLAAHGYEVAAVEPSDAMRAEASRRHSTPRIRWYPDALPELSTVHRTGLTFDVILLSAVWMHVAPADRRRALRKLLEVLRPGGMLVITLRHGERDSQRAIHDVSVTELERLCRDLGAHVTHANEAEDRLGRGSVSWSQVAISLPDDGTGALPLLRHVILNDAKSSTYKLALLRVLCRIADSAHGLVQDRGDDHVAVPLGLVGLYWVRAFRPLLDEGLPQQPGNVGLAGLGFAKAGYRSLRATSPLDLRPGMRFSGEHARSVQLAVREAVKTVVDMPVRYMTGADGSPLLTPIRRSVRLVDSVTIDGEYLRSLGELRVPRHLWRALVRFDSWIEPALVSEWVRLMLGYAARQGWTLDESAMRRALVWSDPERDVSLARRQAAALLEREGAIFCVWSGKRLKAETLDMDHCFPWTAWPCDSLWNLMPASRQINQREKRARLPAAERLEEARARIQDWWNEGYVSDDQALRCRFFTEAISTLPAAVECSLDDVFEGVMTQRLRLREDQQVPEW